MRRTSANLWGSKTCLGNQREAKAIARIRSNGAVTVYDVVDEDDRPWIVMELIEGKSLAEVIRVVDGPLAHVRGQRPEDLGYQGVARALQEVWIALRASEREILELVTIADVAAGKLPERVRDLAADPNAWI